MRRFAALLLALCILLPGCAQESDGLEVQVQREATFSLETTAAETTVPTTVPVTEAATVPTEVPTEPTTEPPTEPPTEASTEEATEAAVIAEGLDYVLNKNSKKFHYPHCGSVKQMKEKNRLDFYGIREEVLNMGYDPCKNCHP